ncbi:hypothetical protein ABPG75_011394 [Micractinium tetrahymenae]
MRAVRFDRFGEAGEVLRLVEDQPMPQRKPGEVLVKVAATSVNPIDYKIRRGDFPRLFVALPKVPGGDVAGVVAEADPGSSFKPGDRVMALADGYRPWRAWGTYCEFVSLPEAHLARIPEGMSDEEAAALPLVSLTVMQALEVSNLSTGDRLLVHGASGGVGVMAVQLAKARGLYVLGTCSFSNADYVKELGCDRVIDYTKERFEDACGDAPLDCVIDGVGGDYEPRSLRLLKRSGTYVSLRAGDTNAAILVATLKGKLLGLLRLGPHYYSSGVSPNGRQLAEVAEVWKEGKLKINVQTVLPLVRAAEAQELVAARHVRGKVVLRVSKAEPEETGKESTSPAGKPE